MLKKYRLLSLFLVLAMLFGGIIATDAHASQNNSASEYEYWNEVHLVDANKEWDITFNQEIDQSTVNKDSVYVTNHLGQKENTTATINSNGKTITLQPPPGGYLPDYDYTLHIENILSKQGKRQKDNIAMRFFIEDNTIKEEVEYRDDVIKLEEATTSLDYCEITMPLSEFTTKNPHEGSIVCVEPSAADIYGYAGKIVSHRTEGEKVIITTTEPLFEEMFTHLHLKGKQEISVAQMMNTQLQPGIEARTYQEYDPQAQKYTPGVEYIFGAKDSALTDVGVEYGDFIIKGSVKVENPGIEYDIKTSQDISSGLKLDRFYLAYTADITSNLEIEYKKSSSKNLDQSVPLFQYPVPLRATGLVADLSLEIYADGDIKSSGKVEATLSQKTKVALGARQAKNGAMEWVRNTSKEQPEFLSAIETEFKANAEAGISPTVELSYYKIAFAGLTGEIGPYLKLDAKATDKGNYADGYFDGKLYAEAGVAFSGTMNLGAAFGEIDKQYSLSRAEIKTWDYTEEYNAESHYFDFDSATGTITKYYPRGRDGDLPEVLDPNIPSQINGVTVTTIGEEAFAKNQLTGVTISNSVTTIGEYAFLNNQLTSVTIPDSVTAIGYRAFFNNQLTGVTIPDSVTTIGNGAFAKNQLTGVTIPNGVTTIGDETFADNPLTSVTIPNGVTAIGERAFAGNQLTGVTIPNSVITIRNGAFARNQLIVVTIPNGVTTIERFAFTDNQLTGVTIANSVTTIGDSAFSYNQLTSVTIPNSVTTIGEFAFANNQLTGVTISNGVTTIGFMAFAGNQLSSVTIPNSVTAIGHGAFSRNPLTSVTIGANVEIISSYGDFSEAYNNGGKKAGTYLLQDKDNGIWVRQ